ncbi:MAG TPA: hypothetical protein VJ898_13205 [Natrialbaceae archaeon]|nr:hypothetical protein [Natrialbaceae archaeon]
MPVNTDLDSRLGSWRREVRDHVEGVVDSDVAGPIGTDADPYSDDGRVGYAPLLVLVAGRRIAEADRSALDPAAAVEFARLHLRTHGTLVERDATAPAARILAGDLYRALANRLLLEQDVPEPRRLDAVDVLSRSVLDRLDALARVESTDFEWLLTDAAVGVSVTLFALEDEQRRTLRTVARRFRSDREEHRAVGPAGAESLDGEDD